MVTGLLLLVHLPQTLLRIEGLLFIMSWPFFFGLTAVGVQE